MEPHMFPHQLIGIIEGILLIVFRKQISVFLEKAYQKFPINKVSGRIYNISYRVRPMYITMLGIVIIGFSILSCFAGS